MSHSAFNINLLTSRPFKYLDMKELDLLMMYCKTITLSDKEILCHQGQKIDGMFIILEGNVALTVKVLGKNKIDLAILSHGNFFGEVSLIKKISSTASVMAEGTVKCLQLTTTYFDMLTLFFPEIRYKIAKAITEEVCARLRNVYNQIVIFINQSGMATQSLISQLKQSFSHIETLKQDDLSLPIDAWESFPFFQHYHHDELKELLTYAHFIKTESNYNLINNNDEHTPYFIVVQGAVQSSILSDHTFAKLSILGPMSTFGNISFIDNKPSIIHYRTCEKATLLSFPEENLINLQKNNPSLWYKIFNSICESFVTLEIAADKLLIRLNSELYNR